jgi:hypothetical protein
LFVLCRQARERERAERRASEGHQREREAQTGQHARELSSLAQQLAAARADAAAARALYKQPDKQADTRPAVVATLEKEKEKGGISAFVGMLLRHRPARIALAIYLPLLHVLLFLILYTRIK